MINNTEFNYENFTLVPPFTKDGKKIVRIQYNGAPATFKSPWLRVAWFNPPYGDEDSLTKPHTLTVQERTRKDFETDEENEAQEENVHHWFEQWRKVYDKFVDYCVENSKMFFGKEYKPSQREVVKALMGTIVEDHEEYPSRMNIKVPNKEGVPQPPVFRMGSKKQLEISNFKDIIEQIPKGSFIRIVFTPSVWIINKKAYMSFYARQVLLARESGRPDFSRCAFDTGPDEVDDPAPEEETTPVEETSAGTTVKDLVDESDDDEEEEDEEEEEEEDESDEDEATFA
tara:strand:- start:2013 stop:2870 length:858 start_codon:yes stop_codon:yes gene_type:complete